jgi:hypothetical protein
MTIVQYFIKETYFKIIYLILLLISIVTITAINIKTLFLYILEPIKKTKLNNFILEYQNSNYKYLTNTLIEKKNNIFIPIVEINIPFYTTSYIYIKYIILFSLYILIPVLIYYVFISVANILKKKEILNIQLISVCVYLFVYINYLVVHYIIIPIYISFIYSHYTEFMHYEFDVEFQLITYLDFYFNTLFINYFLFVVILLKKYLKFNINSTIILLAILLILPLDGFIQITYIILFIIYDIATTFIINYYKEIKKYKQMVYLEKD